MPNKRNEHARIAQSGASNPRPIAQALVDAIGECYTEGVAPNQDPAVYLILHQLVFLLASVDIASYQRYEEAMAAVKEQP